MPPTSESLAHCTSPNSYGIYRIYPDGKVTYSPDEIYSLDTVADSSMTMVNNLEEDSHPCRDSLLYKGSEDDNELGVEVTGCAWNKRTRTKTMMMATRMRVKGSMVSWLGWDFSGVDKRTV
jgi:hypothetical protein